MIILGIIWSILGIILFFKVWSMCNNVRAIKKILNSQGTKQKRECETLSHSEMLNDSKYEIGQLVIIKSNEEQFRIDSIIDKGGEVLYVSKKFNKEFSASEIEDFDEYWGSRSKDK